MYLDTWKCKKNMYGCTYVALERESIAVSVLFIYLNAPGLAFLVMFVFHGGRVCACGGGGGGNVGGSTHLLI